MLKFLETENSKKILNYRSSNYPYLVMARFPDISMYWLFNVSKEKYLFLKNIGIKKSIFPMYRDDIITKTISIVCL
jgi:hypothetical protein